VVLFESDSIVEARCKCNYEYPTTPPDSADLWYSSTGIGDPDSNPGDWAFDSTVSGFADNGTLWELDTFFSNGDPGQYGIFRFSTGAFTSAWSNSALIV